MKIDNFLKPSYLKEKPLSKKVQITLMSLARNAYDLDQSKSISFYYELFVKRYFKQHITENELTDFFGDDPIET